VGGVGGWWAVFWFWVLWSSFGGFGRFFLELFGWLLSVLVFGLRVIVSRARRYELIERHMPEKAKGLGCNPARVIDSGRTAAVSEARSNRSARKQFRIDVIRRDERCCQEVLCEPPRQVRSNAPQRVYAKRMSVFPSRA